MARWIVLYKRILRKLRLRGDLSTRELLPQYEIGVATYGKPEILSWGEGTTLKIGAYCSIAPGVVILLGGEHRMDCVTTYPFDVFQGKGNTKSKGDVVIGNDVWIGREAMIMSGVKINDGAVIAARAVVTKDVAPYSIVGGNPAREIRRRFDAQTIERLLSLGWWDWSEERVNSSIALLLSDDIEAFLAHGEAKKIAQDNNLG